MIIAHLPSGYIVGRLLTKAPLVVPAAVVGGIIPDIDMFWYYFIDQKTVHHHQYWVHIPAFWAVIAMCVLPIILICANRYRTAAFGFFIAVFLHLFLDTIAGNIMWLYPFSDHLTRLVVYPRHYGHWIFNSLFHWVFVLEIGICFVAAVFWFFREKDTGQTEQPDG